MKKLLICGAALLLSACGPNIATKAVKGPDYLANGIVNGNFDRTLSGESTGPCGLYTVALGWWDAIEFGPYEYIFQDLIAQGVQMDHCVKHRLSETGVLAQLESIRHDKVAYNRRIQEIANELRG